MQTAGANTDTAPLQSVKRQKPHYVPPLERSFLTVKETCQVLGMGTTKLYERLAAGDLRKVRDGGRTLVAVDSIRDYIARLDANNQA